MEQQPLYSINSIKTMEVIDVNTGAKLGFIKDFKVDCDSCTILSVIIPTQKISLFGKNDDVEIPWSKITKIGIDVILVNGSDIYHEIQP